MYNIFCKSLIGGKHIKKQIPGEDAGIMLETERCQIFVTADGHGQTSSFRSSVGSRLVCEVASETLKEFVESIGDEWHNYLLTSNKPIEDSKDNQNKLTEKILRQLIRSIVNKWIEKTNEDYTTNPLNAEEIAIAGNRYPMYQNGDGIQHIYGTTLIAGVVTKDYLLLLQQGDGHGICFDENCNPFNPIPWDDNCFSNVTTSLCSSNCIEEFRYCIIDLNQKPILACFLGSDGVEDSIGCADDDFTILNTLFEKYITKACKMTIDEFNEYLEKDLRQITDLVCGDDITLSGIIDCERALPFLDKLATNKAIKEQLRIKNKAQEKMQSMSRKYNGLIDEINKLNAQMTTINETIEQLKHNNEQLVAHLTKKEQEQQEIESEYNKAEHEYSIVKKICDWFLDSQSKKRKITDEINLIKKEILENNEDLNKYVTIFEKYKSQINLINQDFIPYEELYNEQIRLIKIAEENIHKLQTETDDSQIETTIVEDINTTPNAPIDEIVPPQSEEETSIDDEEINTPTEEPVDEISEEIVEETIDNTTAQVEENKEDNE